MKRLVIALGVIMTVILVGLTACQGGETATQQQPVTVTRGDLTVSINGSGFIETSNEAKLSFGTGGKIKEITVDEGDEVKKGQVLAKLETNALELAIAQAQVALAQAQLTQKSTEYELKLIKDKKDPLDLALLNAQISLRTAKYARDKAKDVYRWPEVEKSQADVDKAESFLQYALDGLAAASTPAQVETWTRTVANAQANMATYEAKLKAQLVGYDTEEVIIKDMQVAAAEMALTQAQDNLKKINEKINDEIAIKELQLKFAGESVALAQKSVSEAQRQLNETIILAPFDGVVAKVSAEEGDTISPVNTIIHILDPVSMKLSLELDEIDVSQVKPGQEAVITLDALPGKKFTGKVSNIFPLPKVVGGVVLYDVKINFDVPKDTGIKVGMSASADVIIDKRTDVLLLPSRAVTQDSQGKATVKVMSGGQTTERPVTIGITDDVNTEVISGLTEGETVIVESRAKAKPAAQGLLQ